MNTEKVSVVGIDAKGIKQHSTNPHYIELPFVLSCHPDETWTGICVSMCGSTKPFINRRIFVLENAIIIVANVDDDLEEHKKAVEEVVEKANKKYSALLQQAEQEREQTAKETKQNRAKLDEFKKKAVQLYPQEPV